MRLDEQSHRLTQFVNGNQQIESERLFYSISRGPAVFPALMRRTLWPLNLGKTVITHSDDVFIQSQAKAQLFKVLEKSHPIYKKIGSSFKLFTFCPRVEFLWTYHQKTKNDTSFDLPLSSYGPIIKRQKMTHLTKKSCSSIYISQT